MTPQRYPVGRYVQDMERAKAFYEDAFAVRLEPLPSPGIQMLAFPMRPELPGCAGAISNCEPNRERG